MFIGLSFNGTTEYKRVDTSYGLELLESGKVSSVKVFDADQRVDLTLAATDSEYKSKNLQGYRALIERLGLRK